MRTLTIAGLLLLTLPAPSTAQDRIVHDAVVRLGGSISAEHGIGIFKLDELRHYKSEVELDLMRSLKKAIDAKNLMNPGKIFEF